MIGNILAGAMGKLAIQGDFESISTQLVGAGGAATVTFSSIPSTYTHLQIRGMWRSPSGATEGLLRFNSDSGSNYSRHRLQGNGSSASASGAGSQTAITFAVAYDTANTFGPFVYDVLNYANTNMNKTVRGLDGFDTNGGGEVLLRSGAWLSTNAITSMTFSLGNGQNIAQNSHFALYGIRG